MNHSYGRNLQMLQQQQQDSCFPQVMDANADFQQMLGDVGGDAGPGSYSGLREHGMGHGQQDVEAEQCFVSMASSNTCYPAHSQGGSPVSPPSQSCPWPQFQTSDVLMAGQHGQGYGDLNPLQQHRNGGSETAAMQGAMVSGLGPAMDQCSLSSDQAGLIANPSHMSVHHQRIAASREEMMCSEMGDWCGIAPQQQQHMVDSGMRYLPSVSMLAPGGNGASPRAGGGGGGGGGGMPMSVGGSGNPVARMLNMSQMANNNSSNANANANANNNNSNNNSGNSVVVPMSGGFPGSNLLQSPPGLLAGGGMLVQEGGGVMNPGGAFIPRHGHPLAASPSAHNSFQLFNPAAVSAAMDRVLNRTGSWMGQSMDGGQASMAHLQGACAGPGVRLATSHCLAQFSSDPGFAERAARFSSFTNASRAGPGGNPAMEVRPQQSRRASPVKSGQQNAEEGSRLWRTSSCPPLSTDHLQPNAPANDGQEGSKPAASEAATNSSGSNAPAGMETEQRSPSASTAAESQSQQGAGSDKRRTVPARNSTGKRLARTSSCPSTVVKLPLDAVVKVEEGSEQQKESSDGPEDSSSSDQDKEGSSDSQGKKRKSDDKISASSKNAADNGSRSPSTPAKSAKNEEAAVTNPKRSRGDKDTKSCGDSGDSTSPGPAKESNKPPELPKPDYIHVRARRGQATDSHSLAERVRREKISERMKYLQDLVPGCSKVTGKAVMLDEIINYVQSLQRQVEFLSLKLAAVNPRLEFNMDTIISKEMFQQQRNSLQHQPQQHHLLMGHDTMPMPSPYPTHLLHQQQHQHPMAMQMGATCAMDMRTMGAPYDALRKSMNAPMSPCLDNYGDTVSQTSTVWDNDLHNVVHHMGFGNLPMTSGGSC